MGPKQRSGERDRAGLFRDRQHATPARRSATIQGHQRAYPCRAVGQAFGSRRRGGIPRVGCERLRQWSRPRRRRGLDGTLTKRTMNHLPDVQRTKRLSTDELRSNFLVQGLFKLGEITLRHIDLDRVVLGGAVPLGDPLRLEAPASLAASYFAERREIGILNIAMRGTVVVDGHRYAMACQDVLYVGRGSREVTFESDDAARPARFYIVSYPAHTSHPTARVERSAAVANDLGTPEGANQRRLA